MIKYFVIPEEKKIIAVLDNTSYDAIKKIGKILSHTSGLSFDFNRYRMADRYKATVVCHADDTYNEEEGKRIAKEKLLKHYYESLDKKCNMFIEDLNSAMYEVTVTSCLGHKEY